MTNILLIYGEIFGHFLIYQEALPIIYLFIYQCAFLPIWGTRVRIYTAGQDFVRYLRVRSFYNVQYANRAKMAGTIFLPLQVTA
jgi:hypothetical protein